MSRGGELFTMIVLTVGVATVLYTFSFFMARLVEGDLQARWTLRRRERMLDELDKHFIICGFGRIGQIIAREFARQSVPFVVIERDAERMQEAIDLGYLAVEADASSEQVLQRVRIERARGFIAAVSTDAENVYAVLTARLLQPGLFIIGRAETDDAKAKLVRAGADRVLSPYQIGGPAARPDRAPAGGRRLRPARHQLRQSRLEHGAGADRATARRSPAARFSKATSASASASSSSASSARTAGWSSTRLPTSPCGPGDFLVVLGRTQSLRELEAAAARERWAMG